MIWWGLLQASEFWVHRRLCRGRWLPGFWPPSPISSFNRKHGAGGIFIFSSKTLSSPLYVETIKHDLSGFNFLLRIGSNMIEVHLIFY
ncbi:hypothetical protein CDL15_Pgr007346 [Punica granatum]|uniref:Uncharacterized protein n=1 Tax=Punica granatum TaxID=22663 RepID=A0A218X962_PUNGR|nr:hypothetical protein CDL15_Pgr007346 [Punica granatum]